MSFATLAALYRADDSDIEAHRAHEFESVSARHYAGTKAIVEAHLATLHMVLEMNVHGPLRSELADDFGERQIVSGSETDGSGLNQSAQERLGSDLAVVRIGAAQQFVHQKKRRPTTASQIDNVFQTADFRVETRLVIGQKESLARSEAPICKRDSRSRVAVTGAPAQASTTLSPTARSKACSCRTYSTR